MTQINRKKRWAPPIGTRCALWRTAWSTTPSPFWRRLATAGMAAGARPCSRALRGSRFHDPAIRRRSMKVSGDVFIRWATSTHDSGAGTRATARCWRAGRLHGGDHEPQPGRRQPRSQHGRGTGCQLDEGDAGLPEGCQRVAGEWWVDGKRYRIDRGAQRPGGIQRARAWAAGGEPNK